jgi:hypothetical protein
MLSGSSKLSKGLLAGPLLSSVYSSAVCHYLIAITFNICLVRLSKQKYTMIPTRMIKEAKMEEPMISQKLSEPTNGLVPSIFR